MLWNVDNCWFGGHGGGLLVVVVVDAMAVIEGDKEDQIGVEEEIENKKGTLFFFEPLI